MWHCTDRHIAIMCGRVIQSGGPLRYGIVEGTDMRDNRVRNYPPRWNAAPSQELLVIRRNHDTGVVSLDSLRWGLIPHSCTDPTGGRKPINAKCETVHKLPMFKDAYRRRRCILPVDGFFEWKAIKGQRAKQPYAIAKSDQRAPMPNQRPQAPEAKQHAHDVVTLMVPARLKRVGREMRILVDTADHRTTANASLLRIIARAHHVQTCLIQNTELTVHDIARTERVSAAYIYTLLRLPWLAPDITTAIVNGRQPQHLNAMTLMRRASRLPASWAEQRTLFGFR